MTTTLDGRPSRPVPALVPAPASVPARRLATRYSRRAMLRLGAGALSLPAALGLLAACGGSSSTPAESSGNSGSNPTSVPSSSGAASPTSATAGTSTGTSTSTTTGTTAANDKNAKPPVVLQGVDPETLDPQFGESGISATIYSNCFESLINYDRKMNLVPVLAESWEVMEDKLTWRFKLRQNVTFQNGEPFNADAVKFTVERTLNEDLRKQGLNDPFPSRTGITAVNIIDPYTVDMVLKEPNVVFPVFVYFLYMLEPKYYAATSIQDTALHPIGTGPWKVTEWVKGDHLTLEVFPDYWRGDPGIPSITFKPVPEQATRLNMLTTGETDITGDLTPEDFPTVEGDDKLRVSRAPGSRRMHMGIPANIPRYKERAVRQALLQAIDYDGMAKALLGPMAAERRSNVLVAGEAWLNTDIPLIKYDPDAAKSALQAANFPFDDKITIYSTAGRYLRDTELAQAIAGYYRKIGLNAEAQVLDWAVYTDKMRGAGLDDLYILGLGSRLYGPEDVSIVTTGQVWDQTHWIDSTENGPKFQEMYKELLQTFDVDKQHEMVNEMQQLFVEEAVWAPLWIQPGASGVNKRVTWEDSGGGDRFTFWLPNEDPTKVTS